MRAKTSVRHSLVALAVVFAVALVLAGRARPHAPVTSPMPPSSSGLVGSSGTAPYSQYDLVFAVAGDSRTAKSWMKPSAHRDYTPYINAPALGALQDDLIKTWAGSPGFFFVHLGDFGIRGGTPVFKAFKRVMAPMQTAKIPVYPVLGNHEVRYYVPKADGGGKGAAEDFPNARKAQEQYQAAFKAPWMMPADATFPSGYEGLAYTFRRGSSAFIVVDAYFASKADDVYKKGYYSDFQLKWLQDTLIAYRKDTNVKNILVMSHQPAFFAARGDGKFYNKYDSKTSDAGARSTWIMWALMDTYGVDAFFCGHSHFYHRWNVTGDAFAYAWDKDWSSLGSEFEASGIRRYITNSQSWQTTIPQVLNGTCGAPPDPLVKNPQVAAEAGSEDYNFSIVYVKGDTLTVEVYSYGDPNKTWEPKLIDKFQKADRQWRNLPLIEEPR